MKARRESESDTMLCLELPPVAGKLAEGGSMFSAAIEDVERRRRTPAWELTNENE